MQLCAEIPRGQLRRLLLVLASGSLAIAPPTRAGLRRIQVGEIMPEFSLTGVDGQTFEYPHAPSGVLGVVVMQAAESHLDRLISDIETVIEKMDCEGTPLVVIGVLSGPDANDRLRRRPAEAQAILPIFPDPNFALWGKLGVIAAPTAIVAGADHRVQWIKAGYGYDFIASFHAQLAEALEPSSQVDASVEVRTLENASERARRTRHLQMARAMAKKGRFEAALRELDRLRALDPNDVEITLEWAEVLVMAGKNEAALKAVAGVDADSESDQARVLLISGWARRQMGQIDVAESLLTRALVLAPESARALYELGRIHESRGDLPQAVSFYRRALMKVFGEVPPGGGNSQ